MASRQEEADALYGITSEERAQRNKEASWPMFKITTDTGVSFKLSAEDRFHALDIHDGKFGWARPAYVDQYVRVNAQDLVEGDYCHASKETVVAKAPIYPGDKKVGLVLRCERRDTTRSARWGRYTKIGVLRNG